MIFVFGSNLAGRHRAGAALYARKHHGAEYGVGVGIQGNSYAIPTKDEHLNTLPLATIKEYVTQFVNYASLHNTLSFMLTRINYNLTEYKDEEIVNLFPKKLPENIYVPPQWSKYFPVSLVWE